MIFNDIEKLAKLFAYIMSFLSIISIGVLIMINRKDPEKRKKAIQGLFYVCIAAFVITSAYYITNNINGLIGKFANDINHNFSGGSTGGITAPTTDIKIGFGEGILIGIIEFAVTSFRVMREWILGADISIQNVLFNIEENPLVNLNVPLKNGTTVNLFNLILVSSAVFIYIMVVRTGHSIINFATDERKGAEVREYLLSWGLIIIYIASAPAFVYVMLALSNYLLGLINQIDFNNSYAAVYDMDARDYGVGVSIAKLYMIYLEFKLWTIMIFRKIVLNGFYALAPIALIVGQLKEFNASNVWLNIIIKFAVYPFYYAFAFVISTVVLNGMPNGDNPIVIIIVYGMIFKLVDIIITVFTVHKVQENARNNTPGGATMMGMVAYAITTFVRMNNSKGGKTFNGTSNATSSTQNNTTTTGSKVFSAITSYASNAVKNTANKIGVSKGLVDGVSHGLSNGAKYGGIVGGALGKAVNSNITKTALAVGAGMAVASVGENPLTGLAAFQGTKMVLNKMPMDKVGKGLGKVSGASANAIVGGMQSIGQAMSSKHTQSFASADIKSHSRR
ncbi:hypothetical protein HZI73_26185 (plasmid) [Vallitalea pronyensis]|uniref:Uncharacterized protein n=1 Tax=Vallitalea pronyensis TaxID=1348613 RepID=A0A8J8SJU9_9FIRM|nr:hypothetical protein [Vallitalea pronyensis]QUI25904.1 hypothetical protein HZI73_26185 [Vallitalea pronyensis]